jgi:hypothetical protein
MADDETTACSPATMALHGARATDPIRVARHHRPNVLPVSVDAVHPLGLLVLSASNIAVRDRHVTGRNRMTAAIG